MNIRRCLGFSLIEMMVVIGIVLTMAVLVAPAFGSAVRHARFADFTSRLEGHLWLGRQQSKLLGVAVALEIEPTEQEIYRLRVAEPGGDWRTVASVPIAGGNDNGIGARLPNIALPHPTRKGLIHQAITSSQGSRIIFRREGSSSATIVFSDGDDRVLCVLLAGHTGRFRLFSWEQSSATWVAL